MTLTRWPRHTKIPNTYRPRAPTMNFQGQGFPKSENYRHYRPNASTTRRFRGSWKCGQTDGHLGRFVKLLSHEQSANQWICSRRNSLVHSSVSWICRSLCMMEVTMDTVQSHKRLPWILILNVSNIKYVGQNGPIAGANHIVAQNTLDDTALPHWPVIIPLTSPKSSHMSYRYFAGPLTVYVPSGLCWVSSHVFFFPFSGKRMTINSSFGNSILCICLNHCNRPSQSDLKCFQACSVSYFSVQVISLHLWSAAAVVSCGITNKKLHYREEHSASFVLCWCIMTFLGRKSVWLINHFYVIGHESYRIRRNNAK